MIKKFSLHCIEKVLFFIGIFLLTSEILKQLLLTFVVNNGHYNLWYFPFQLCSLPMYLLVLYPFFHTEPARNTILGFLSTYNLLGGIAVFFDTSGMHYPLLILTVHSYLWHILLIVAEYLNHILDSFGEINLFYINPDYRMEQIFFVKIGELYGNNSAILVYILATISGAGILYGAWNLMIRFYSSH